jgi:hypothetical protein
MDALSAVLTPIRYRPRSRARSVPETANRTCNQEHSRDIHTTPELSAPQLLGTAEKT